MVELWLQPNFDGNKDFVCEISFAFAHREDKLSFIVLTNKQKSPPTSLVNCRMLYGQPDSDGVDPSSEYCTNKQQ